MQPDRSSSVPPPSRYITGIDQGGRSIVLASPEVEYWDRGGYALARLYSLERVPASLRDDADLKSYLSAADINVVVPGGANFLQGDFGPLSSSPWHRTISIDFVTIIAGVLELELEDDKSASDDQRKIIFRPGVSIQSTSMAGLNEEKILTGLKQDSVVQRGTMHRWINASPTTAARFVAVTIACEPFKVGDSLAEQVFLPK